ncbi:MAG: MarR family winged helix-turn-helix transcriptional regulator [Ktedonobacterales bacterium]
MNKHPAPLLVSTIERAAHAVALWTERSFEDLRLTQAEAHVLAFLAEHAPCSINELHHSFGHKRSTLTSLLDRLESRGWARREPHPTSRREVLVQLTDTGRPVADRVNAGVHDLERRVLARTSAESVATVQRVITILEEELR